MAFLRSRSGSGVDPGLCMQYGYATTRCAHGPLLCRPAARTVRTGLKRTCCASWPAFQRPWPSCMYAEREECLLQACKRGACHMGCGGLRRK